MRTTPRMELTAMPVEVVGHNAFSPLLIKAQSILLVRG